MPKVRRGLRSASPPDPEVSTLCGLAHGRQRSMSQPKPQVHGRRSTLSPIGSTPLGSTEAKSAMSNQNLAVTATGRRDHYVPQAYLRGFIHPQRRSYPKPLWVLDLRRHEWYEKSPYQIGWEYGFYDYSAGSNPDATAEDAFRSLENDIPRIRDYIRANGHQCWTMYRNVLIDFAAMMAARSPLFRTQAISEVGPSLDDDPSANALAKNYSITLMRAEMRQRPKEWRRYDWILRYTENPESPFVAADQVVGMRGNALSAAEALRQNDFWLWCPLSWDMCLIASSQPLDAEPTAPLQPEHVAEIQTLTKQQAQTFVASPVRIPHLATD